MTEQARWVLRDCEHALLEIVDNMPGSLWRRRYVATIALLRTVGHVLDKVDGERSPRLRAAIDEAFKKLKLTKPAPAIYWSFIEAERNLLLKEYRPAALRNFIFEAVGDPVVDTNAQGRRVEVYEAEMTRQEYLITSGPFTGRHARELIAEAIEWWRKYLDAVDAAAT